LLSAVNTFRVKAGLSRGDKTWQHAPPLLKPSNTVAGVPRYQSGVRNLAPSPKPVFNLFPAGATFTGQNAKPLKLRKGF
jgi:hypothetical protein